VRRTLQVHVTAWMLCAEVDEAGVGAHLGTLAADMKGF
jgi:hypothetical protein